MADIDREATREALRRLGQPDVLGNELPPVEDVSKDFLPEPISPATTAARAADIARPRSADPLSKNFESDLAAEGSLSAATSDPALVRTAAAADPSTDPSLAAVAPAQAAPAATYTDTAQAAQAPRAEAPAAERAAPPPPPAPATPPAPPPAAPRAAATKSAAPQAVTVTVQQPAAVSEPAPGQAPTDAQLLAAGGRGANAPRPAVDENHDGIEDKAINLNQSARGLRAESQMGTERQRQLMGEDSDAQRALAAREIGIEAGRAAEGAERLTDIEGRTEGYRKRFEETRAQYQAELADLKERMGKPPSGAIAAIMGIAATIAAAKDKGALANALQGVGQTLTQNAFQRWQAGISAGQGQLEGMGKLVNLDHLANTDEATQYQDLYKAKDAEIQAAFTAARRDAKTQHEINALDMAENAYAKQSKDAQLALLKKQEEAALRQRATREMQIANASGDPAKIAAARIKYGELGEKVRQVGTKTDQGLLNLDKTEAGIVGTRATAALHQAKADAAAGKGDMTGSGVVRGWTATKKLPSGAEAAIAKDARLFGGINELVNRQMNLARQVQKNGKDWLLKDPNAQNEANDIRTMKASLRNQASGAGSPTGDEFVRQFENDPDIFEVLTRKNALDILQRQDKNNRRIYEGGLREVGYMPDEEYASMKAQGKAPRAQTGGLVEMRSPDGTVDRYSPGVASALERVSGFTRADDTEE